MKPSLSFKLAQSLALTPQLQQSIRLLQLSATELEQELIEACQENPLLEFESTAQQAPIEPITQLSHLPYQGPLSQDDDDDRLGNIRTKTSLLDHLLEQIKLLRISPSEKALIALIAGNLDEKGYLTLTLDDLAHDASDFIDPEDGEPTQQIARALQLLQHLDPAGVGARDQRDRLGQSPNGASLAPTTARQPPRPRPSRRRSQTAPPPRRAPDATAPVASPDASPTRAGAAAQSRPATVPRRPGSPPCRRSHRRPTHPPRRHRRPTRLPVPAGRAPA